MGKKKAKLKAKAVSMKSAVEKPVKKLPLKRESKMNGVEPVQPVQSAKVVKPTGVFAPSNQQPEKKDVFRLKDSNLLTDWLGELQRFRLAIILSGPTHTLKSETKNQILNGFAELGLNIADFDMEQGGLESRDTQESYDRNITPQNRERIHCTGHIPSSLEELYELIEPYDVVSMDSFNKFMTKANLKGTDFDQIRLDRPDKIWITIFQLRDDGKIRSGSSPGYDSPLIIETGKEGSTFETAYAEIKKNRGNPDTLGLRYYPVSGRIQRSEDHE